MCELIGQAENMSLSLIALKIGVHLEVYIKFNAPIMSILAQMCITCYGYILQNCLCLRVHLMNYSRSRSVSSRFQLRGLFVVNFKILSN